MPSSAGVKYAPNETPPPGATKVEGFIFNPNPTGPTSVTGYYSDIDIPQAGYAVYSNKESQGPSIYKLNNNGDLVNLYYAFADEYVLTGSPQMALALTKVNPLYSGSCMTIRRGNDNNETNIGFVGNDLDISSINTFCSGTTCFVKTWFDQYQNGGDANQNTPNSQPIIYNSGNIITLCGEVAISFGLNGDWRTLSGTTVVNGLNQFTMDVTSQAIFDDDEGTSIPYIISWGNYSDFSISGVFFRNAIGRIYGDNLIGFRFGTNDYPDYYVYQTTRSSCLLSNTMIKFYSNNRTVFNNSVLMSNLFGRPTPMSATTNNYIINNNEGSGYYNFGVFISKIVISYDSTPPSSGVDYDFARFYIENIVPETVIIDGPPEPND